MLPAKARGRQDPKDSIAASKAARAKTPVRRQLAGQQQQQQQQQRQPEQRQQQQQQQPSRAGTPPRTAAIQLQAATASGTPSPSPPASTAANLDLYVAAALGQVPEVTRLVAEGVNPNEGLDGDTPMHAAGTNKALHMSLSFCLFSFLCPLNVASVLLR